MVDVYRVIVSPEAHDNLREILEYIALSSPANAATTVDTLLDAIAGLNILPKRLQVARGSKRLSISVRCMPVPPYRVTYRVIERHHLVRILRVEHGSRNH